MPTAICAIRPQDTCIYTQTPASTLIMGPNEDICDSKAHATKRHQYLSQAPLPVSPVIQFRRTFTRQRQSSSPSACRIRAAAELPTGRPSPGCSLACSSGYATRPRHAGGAEFLYWAKDLTSRNKSQSCGDSNRRRESRIWPMVHLRVSFHTIRRIPALIAYH